MNHDAWVASLSNGETIVEHWIPNELSPWLRLMEQCKERNLHLTNLRLTICSKTICLRPRAMGYWQAHQKSYLSNTSEIPVSRGIGFIEDNNVKIIWGIRTLTNQPYFWSEERSIDEQSCVIWSPGGNIISV